MDAAVRALKPGEAALGSRLQGYLMVRGVILPIPQDRPMYIGRDKIQCELAMPDQRVSKRHVVVTYQNNKYFVEDLGSLNSTFVNGERLQGKIAMVPGDEIRILPYTMLFIGPDELDADPSHRAARLSHQDDASHFSGQLSILKLIDLIQLINSTSQSGLLNIRDQKDRKSTVVFVKGEIVKASYRSFVNEEAIYALIGIPDGEFDFIRGEQPMPRDPITKRTQTLLFEACQLLDERKSGMKPGDTMESHTAPLFSPADPEP